MKSQTALDECAREPIHLCGAIQPHGVLVSVRLSDWTVAHATANADTLFGASTSSLRGLPLSELLDQETVEALQAAAGQLPTGEPPVPVAWANLGLECAIHELGLHLNEGLAHIEIELQGKERVSANELSHRMVTAISAAERETFFDVVAKQVHELTGYDRVMVYRFLEDESGEVIAEARTEGVPTYRGLRFPASDIPPQARALYTSNRVRIIPDIRYQPVPLEPALSAEGHPVDLGQAYLRSVSPVHLQYLANMGVGASMSISIVCEGRLWGLIACHHLTPRAVSPAARRATYLFGLFVSLRVESEELRAVRREAEQLRGQLGDIVHPGRSLIARLGKAELGLLRSAFQAHAALWLDTRHPAPPSAGLTLQASHDLSLLLGGIRQPLLWADTRVDWTADTQCPYAGVLAIRIDPDRWLVLLRRERVTEVTWAGRPDVPYQRSGALPIGPRTSFDAWTHLVAGRSRPWTPAKIEVAGDIQRMLERARAPGNARDVGGQQAASNAADFDVDDPEPRENAQRAP